MNEDFLAAVRQLAARLESDGHADAAAELRNGLGCLNGLTDGWGLFLESIDRIDARRFSDVERDALAEIRDVAHKAVYRR